MDKVNEPEILIAKQKLLSELDKGRRSGEEQGYLDVEDVLDELEMILDHNT